MRDFIEDAGWAVYRFFRWTVWRFPKQVKWHWQRAFRGWGDCDVWNMNDYLIRVIPAMLRHLKNKRHSYPVEFRMMEFDDKKNDVVCRRTDEEASAAWGACLQNMIDGLEAVDRVEDTFDSLERKQENIDAYLKDLNRAVDRRTEAFALFAKHFGHLWD